MNINLLTETELASLQQLIADANNIIVCCHKSPDGDAIGSSLGWAEYLCTLGKNPTVVVPDAYPDFLQWLPGTEKIVRYDKHPDTADGLFANADLVFCLDLSRRLLSECLSTTIWAPISLPPSPSHIQR